MVFSLPHILPINRGRAPDIACRPLFRLGWSQGNQENIGDQDRAPTICRISWQQSRDESTTTSEAAKAPQRAWWTQQWGPSVGLANKMLGLQSNSSPGCTGRGAGCLSIGIIIIKLTFLLDFELTLKHQLQAVGPPQLKVRPDRVSSSTVIIHLLIPTSTGH